MDANYDPGVGVLADMNARLPKGDIQLLRTALDVMLHRMRTRNIPEGGKARFDPPDKGTRAGAGDTSVSPIGAKWKRLSRTKAFVSATRAVDRFRVEYRFVDEEKTQPVQPGVKYQAHGGVTLSFRGAAVRLEMLDLVGNRAQPGEQRSGPACFQLYYHLAPGETWDVTRRGVVEIRRKR
jgi:hypothetical protein